MASGVLVDDVSKKRSKWHVGQYTSVRDLTGKEAIRVDHAALRREQRVRLRRGVAMGRDQISGLRPRETVLDVPLRIQIG